jgi:hypothetical protein
MPTLADPAFDRFTAHRDQCAQCKAAKSYEDPALCRVGAALARAWMRAESNITHQGGWRIRPAEETR